MTTVLCTLYNSLYLDKGLVLYDSLRECAKDFKLYVLCMDEKCYEILTELCLPNQFPIRLRDFENDELIKAKGNRSFGEYCWTCSSSLIKYVLIEFEEPVCAYIDADMFFYSDPNVLFKELEDNGASVMVTPHRFDWLDRKEENKVGRYCVEFNLFKNNKESITLLDTWICQCIEKCAAVGDGKYWGDQKYTDNWVEDYSFVMATNNLGAGVAPWNLSQYKMSSKWETDRIIISNQKEVILVFFHFENLQFHSGGIIEGVIRFRWNTDFILYRELYSKYINRLADKKKYLRDNYSIDLNVTVHPVLAGIKVPSLIKRTLGNLFVKGGLSHLLFVSLPNKIYGKRAFFITNSI